MYFIVHAAFVRIKTDDDDDCPTVSTCHYHELGLTPYPRACQFIFS